jgi:SNF2 family DNA or RNA helicase
VGFRLPEVDRRGREALGDVSPLSTLERTWGDEVFQNFPHLNFCIVHGEKALRQRLLADDSYDVYIINHHGIRVVEKEIIAADIRHPVVVDEGATFRNASTELWKSLNRISARRARVWG